jgi:hypothetical protein
MAHEGLGQTFVVAIFLLGGDAPLCLDDTTDPFKANVADIRSAKPEPARGTQRVYRFLTPAPTHTVVGAAIFQKTPSGAIAPATAPLS